MSHHIPTVGGDVLRLRTGYERVLAHRTTSSFAGAARFDGVVKKVDKKLKMIRVEYTNDEVDVFSYADLHTGSSGLVIEQHMELAVTEGQQVKRGDVLVYNKEFFKPDPYSTQVDWKHGVMANVVLAERNTTLQDANCISARLGKEFTITPVEVVTVTLDNNSMVHEMLRPGQEVKRGDILITFEDGELGEVLNINTNDTETLEMIQSLNRNSKKAPISGHIAKIDALYGCPISEMHPTLAGIVKDIDLRKQAAHKFSKDTDAEYDFPLTGPLPKGEKFKNIDFNEHTVVLQFYIKEEIDAGIGDKIVYDSSLKSVISDVMDEPMVTQSGIEVDAVFSGTGINRRTITSPLTVGTVQRTLEKLEFNIIDMWDKKKVVSSTESLKIDKCPVLDDTIIKPLYETVLNDYNKKFHWNLSYMKYDFSDVPMDTNGKQTNSISKEEFGMCWTKNNIIYINPNFRFVIKHYSKTDSVDDINDFNSIVMHTLAHELAHEVYNTDKLSNTIFKNNIINEAKKERFTTDYLDNTNYSGAKYDSELFAEYIAFKVTGK